MYPSILNLAPLDDDYLQCRMNDLNREIANRKRSDHASIKSGIKDILFIRYSLFVLSLIKDGDKRAKNFIRKASISTHKLSNANINYWCLTIPNPHHIESHLDSSSSCESTGHDSYYVSLNEILYGMTDETSREHKIVCEMASKYVLVEIVDCNEEIYYSYIETHELRNNNELNTAKKTELVLSIDCGGYDIRIKYDERAHDECAHDERAHDECARDECARDECTHDEYDDSHTNNDCDFKPKPNHTVCTDMFIVLLYILTCFIKLTLGIDLLCLLDSADRLPASVRANLK